MQHFVTALFTGQHYFFGPKVSNKTNVRYTLQHHPIRQFFPVTSSFWSGIAGLATLANKAGQHPHEDLFTH
jgi:hypothetical protein